MKTSKRKTSKSAFSARCVTPPMYAKRLGSDPEHVVALIHAGLLKAIDVALPGAKRPRFRIPPEAIVEFERARSVVPMSKTVRRRRSPAEKVIEFF